MAETAIKDLRLALTSIAISPKYEQERPGFMPKYEKGIEDISNYLGSKKWLMGDNALPKIKEYMSSERFISWPLHQWSATFYGEPRSAF
ncbi:unnamed protein product [Dibothriocephalus latus]|uniref:Uncharacterized protein n=1 Tax=Dibothriocephalus latus TaxID=60516 RepID=A0A3P7LHN3_DIBLA|nr:unnamed protein product [Dibothriocephalus latus]